MIITEFLRLTTVTALSRHDGIESQNLRRGLHQVMRRSVMMPRKMREGVIHLYKWVGRCWCYARWGVTVSNLLAPGDPLLQVGPDTQYTNAQMRCQSSVTFSKWGCPDAIKLYDRNSTETIYLQCIHCTALIMIITIPLTCRELFVEVTVGDRHVSHTVVTQQGNCYYY